MIMKKSNKKIVILWSILFFSITLSTTSCRQQKRTCDAENQIELTDTNNEFIGVWESVGIPYFIEFQAHLTIYSNHYFVFDGGACMSSFASWGSWMLNGDTIILNSFEPEECFYIWDFGINCTPVDDAIRFQKTYENCEMKSLYFDFTFFRFTNERFVIKDSILTHIPRFDISCTDMRDIFFKITNNIDSKYHINN